MLVELRVSNFRSFNQEQTFSLVAGRDRKHPENLIDVSPCKLLKAAAIFGANASGKSNLVRAIRVMRNFVRTSATKMTQGDRIPGMVPFRLSSATRDQPSRFGVTLVIKDRVYDYGFSADEGRVCEEALSAGPASGRMKAWFTRTYDPARGQYDWFFDEPLREAESVLKERTRDNGLALSRAGEQNVKPLSDLFLALTKEVRVFDLSEQLPGLYPHTAGRMKKDGALAERVIRLTRDADFSIEGVSVDEGPPPAAEQIDMLKKVLSEEVVRKMAEGVPAWFTIHTWHRKVDTGEIIPFDMMEDESNGTKRFFSAAAVLIDAIDQGWLVVVDELDCSMHPHLTRKLVELFQSPAVNSSGAQLVFTTHDTTLMTPAIFRRDQVWLVEKDPSGASQLKSLYDFKKPRSTESFQKNYLAGRYGAVPNLGPAFEDLEIK